MAFAPFLALFFILNFNQLLTAENPNPNPLQTYIVHVDSRSTNLDAFYESFFATKIQVDSAGDPPRILHRYRNIFTGFAAKLSVDQVKSMREMEGFVSARPERVYQLHTTHSPSFLGLNPKATGFWKGSNYGKGVIIGLFDTGITPDHPSFSDHGMPRPPKKWKGKCEFGSGSCNNKLIGARVFGGGNVTPVDEEGHGTHTAGTAAGNFVAGANIFGNANGTASGTAPLSHLAIYRVCSPIGCGESDIIAGMDAAIEDGVDVMSLSLGGTSFPFYVDNIALGAYRAIQKGIFVSCSAGNGGSDYNTTSNEAPWILTVGASTINRKLTSTVVLGDGQELTGESAFQPENFDSITEFELYEGEKCTDDSELNKDKIEGKIVLCELGENKRTEKGVAVKNNGGAAMILMNGKDQGYTLSAEAHALPASHIAYADAIKLKSYINSSSKPTAKIEFKGTLIGDNQAPIVAYYSSRGPSLASPGILKPDIIGPGNNILAAWHTSLEQKSKSKSKSNFNMISGTSMSCPHLSGVAALLKNSHPDWSPAAIKSAIMTTADQVNLSGKPIKNEKLLPADVFAVGAGHVNPRKANDPGLIYDIHADDYLPYLCGLNFTNKQVGSIVHRKVDCSKEKSIPEAQLNYPSFSIKLGSTQQITYTRTVTNVGRSNSSYHVKIVSPKMVDVKVNPSRLEFSKVGQSLKYSVTFSRLGGGGGGKTSQGAIKWVSGRYSVRSPIAIMFG